MPAVKSFIVTRDRPIAELVAERLQELPTLMGRLVYLARCISSSGRYVHEGLRMTHDRASIEHALSAAHLQCFDDWLGLSLQEQHADFTAYLDGLNRRRALQAWNQSAPWKALCPPSAEAEQRELFATDLRVVITNLLRTPSADPGAGT